MGKGEARQRRGNLRRGVDDLLPRASREGFRSGADGGGRHVLQPRGGSREREGLPQGDANVQCDRQQLPDLREEVPPVPSNGFGLEAMSDQERLKGWLYFLELG